MAQGKRDGDQSIPLSIANKKARKDIVINICNDVQIARDKNQHNSGAQAIIENAKMLYPWITRHIVNGCLRRAKSKIVRRLTLMDTTQDIQDISPLVDTVGGRPKGSTIKSKLDIEHKKELARNEISKLYFESKRNNNGRLPRGQFKMIHDATIKKYSLVNKFSISPKLIQSRIRRKKLTVLKTDSQSPMNPVEPVIKQIVVWKQEAGQPITPAEGLAVVNSLIDGTEVQNKLKEFQRSKQKPPTGVLSNKYWKLFMRRHKESLQARKGYRVASNRTEWVTYENVNIMYDLCYEQMVDAGIAVKLPESEQYYVNEDGEEVESDDMVGHKVKVKITHPEWLLFGDEVGSDISQKDDGNVGGQLFVTTKGTRGNIKSSHTDGRFTLIGLTAASGDAVMAIIIFAGEELSFEQRMGHDIRVPFDTTKSVTENSGPGKTFPGAPTCSFRGKAIPALIACSKKGSITSDILKSAFERLDQLGVYERRPNLKPMALFDAHDSRLQVPFLRYVNNPQHRWIFCIGLPNGTHKWQVGDSKEQNGSYKVEWTREKAKLVQYRVQNGLSACLEKSDCLPLLNIIWSRSFGRKATNKKAIADRGWNPCNRRLLTDPEILKTKTNATATNVRRDETVAATNDTGAGATENNSITTTNDTGASVTSRTISTCTATNTVANTVATNNSTDTVATNNTGNTTIATQVVPSPWIDLTDLNFERGLAGEFTVDILQHMVRKEKVNDNLNNRYREGQATRGNIDTARRLTGGSLFKCHHIVLDSEVLMQREAKEKEKCDEKTKTVLNAIAKYNSYKAEFEKLREKNIQESTYKGKEFKVVINWKKREGDKAIPSKVSDLKIRYNETKDRSDLTLRAYLTDRGYTKTGSGFEDIANSLVVAAEESAVEGTVIAAAIDEAPQEALRELPEANYESLSQIQEERI